VAWTCTERTVHFFADLSRASAGTCSRMVHRSLAWDSRTREGSSSESPASWWRRIRSHVGPVALLALFRDRADPRRGRIRLLLLFDVVTLSLWAVVNGADFGLSSNAMANASSPGCQPSWNGPTASPPRTPSPST